jgi:7-keto-8-aminopelargonate synthetase-like enzyme
MRTMLTAAFALCLVAAPATARADLGGCFAGPNELNRCSVSGAPAAIRGASAAPVLIAGAAVTVAHELHRRTEERDAAATSGSRATGKHAPPSLALVPDPPDPYRAGAGKAETRTQPSAAFRFNDTATNVATVVAGAAVVGAVIGTIVNESRHK